MKSRTANGEVGDLIYCHASNKFVFRVYDAQYNFTDYDIKHCDMRIKIIDADAHFYEGTINGRDICDLDHSPLTLGIK